MKYILLIFVFVSSLVSSTYMGKIEPLEEVVLKSEVGGIVKYVKKSSEYSFVKKNQIVKLDTSSLDFEIRSLSKEVFNQRKVFKIQEKRYKSKSRISSISEYEKNQEELAMRQALQSLYGLKKQLQLKKIMRSKYLFSVSKKYIGDIYVKPNDFISVGSKIIDVYDISKLKIVLFVSKDDVLDLKSKSIYVDGKKSNFKIRYISNVPDSKYVSSYKVELVKKNTNKNFIFGKVARVEFR